MSGGDHQGFGASITRRTDAARADDMGRVPVPQRRIADSRIRSNEVRHGRGAMGTG